MTDVRLRDGIRIELANGTTTVADARVPDGDVALLSHAHGDHLYDEPPEAVVASSLTLDLAEIRRSDGERPDIADHPAVETMSAGHVPGSLGFRVGENPSYLYTGDCSTRDRFGMAGFEPVDADVLIVESTYGKPAYRFPDQSAVEAEIVDWLVDTRDSPVMLMGYALGRAQELLRLADRAERSRIFMTPAIENLNRPITAATGREFRGSVYEDETELGPGDALVLPSQTNSLSFVDRLQEKTGAVKAGFSGWATADSYRFARDLDVAFPLSDHCDFEELLSVVRRVDPDRVYTVHGFVDEFATAIKSRLGIEATALKRNQTALGDF